jgi:hypothetical protein
MQRTADFLDAIANADLPQAARVVDDATALDTAVDVLERIRRRAMRRFAAFWERVRARPRGFQVGMMIATWASVHART